MLTSMLFLSLLVLSLAILGCLYRVLRGPSMADRITALDTIGINVIAVVAVLSMMLHTQAYLDIILLIGILAFLSTVAFARYIERGAVFKNEGDR
ncbi:Na(+)/H(+) antiporter subunit F1 [Paenibacillus xylanilyticus]|uniref:Na(+)/H(+) antiporter subunit F1 n=1 Tax=Paenibacillus xylanilyticus TaxID=248903 RepID=A0A7Y6BXE1_9BACL|nr:Na(+)/H(+) antiporter subunit F1 [Paenibacillus xylanilyticus]NUU76581.1 Na(+)/H(+) antiporter subunit F1 [Paenibacillus xylanilyticus]